MLAATGETGRKPRLRMAKSLAQRHGYTCVIMSTPYYGRRKPAHQYSFYLETVSDMWRQYGAVVQETAAMAEYFLRQHVPNDDCRVCITGFSAGACLALCAAWTCVTGYRIADASNRVTVAAHATPASAAVFVSGSVRYLMDWQALRGDEPQESLETTRKLLQQELDLLSVRQAVALGGDSLDSGNPRLGSIQCTVFKHDCVSPPGEAQVLAEILPAMTTNDAALDWLAGGHVMAYWIRPQWQNRLIVRALASLRQQHDRCERLLPCTDTFT